MGYLHSLALLALLAAPAGWGACGNEDASFVIFSPFVGDEALRQRALQSRNLCISTRDIDTSPREVHDEATLPYVFKTVLSNQSIHYLYWPSEPGIAATFHEGDRVPAVTVGDAGSCMLVLSVQLHPAEVVTLEVDSVGQEALRRISLRSYDLEPINPNGDELLCPDPTLGQPADNGVFKVGRRDGRLFVDYEQQPVFEVPVRALEAGELRLADFRYETPPPQNRSTQFARDRRTALIESLLTAKLVVHRPDPAGGS